MNSTIVRAIRDAFLQLTRLLEYASASDRSPSAPISFNHTSRLVSVYKEVMRMTVCGERRLLISLDWSSVHQPVSSLQQNLSSCILDSERWVSTGNDGDDGVRWGRIADLTWLFLIASASDFAPSSSTWFSDRYRVVSVYTKQCRWRCVMGEKHWSHLVGLECIGQWARPFSTYLVVW